MDTNTSRIYEAKDIGLNKLEKKSFYSFLALYLGSSLFFLLLSGYWYFNAQKNSLQSETYYKLQHLADKVSSLIIHAQMSNTKLTLPKAEKNYEYKLIKTQEHKSFEKNYFEKEGYTVLISSAPQEHLNIQYVIVQTNEYHRELEKLQREVLSSLVIVFILIVIISLLLSKLFMRPIYEKMTQIEGFIQDVSHELNTPITALQMSSKRAIQKGVFDKKILTNISISSKQLYSIYQSLSYLSFHTPLQEPTSINLKPILEYTLEYYGELSHAKNVTIHAKIEDATLKIIEGKAQLLFSNLISNAIKYSMPEKTITIILRDGYFQIQDEGIGIHKEKLKEIFNLYARASNLAGGFGVGLNIVKQICDEFGITIDVNSELDRGSHFTLTWKKEEASFNSFSPN